MNRKPNRLLRILFKCEQEIHNQYGNDPDDLAKGAPPPWSQKQREWFQQRVELFKTEADWATEEEMRTLHNWLGKSALELNAKDVIVRSCVEGLVHTVNKFLHSKGHH
jgi:hypothetical protein